MASRSSCAYRRCFQYPTGGMSHHQPDGRWPADGVGLDARHILARDVLLAQLQGGLVERAGDEQPRSEEPGPEDELVHGQDATRAT